MSKILLIAAITLFRVGSPDSIESAAPPSDDPKLSSESQSQVDAAGQTSPLEYSGVKILKSHAEFNEFINLSPLSIIYFKPEVELTAEQRNNERHFLDASKNASEYLRWGFDVRVGRIDCANVKQGKKLHERVCAPEIAQANVARFFRKRTEIVDLEISSLFDEDSIMANVLTILLINDIPIVENPDEIMELQEQNLKKRNIVFTYYERIGSGTHRNIMEVAYNYKSKFRFVITSYNDSLAYLHLPGVDLAKLPETKIMVLLCAEAEYAPCPLTSFPDSKQTITQYDFLTYLDNILRDPIVEYPAIADSASSDMETQAAPESIDLTTFKSAFADVSIHEMRIIYDSRAPKGEQAKKFLKDSARGLSLQYMGLVGFVMIDRAFLTPPPEDTSIPALSSVTVKLLPLSKDEDKQPPKPETFHFHNAFSFDGPSFRAFTAVLEKMVKPSMDEEKERVDEVTEEVNSIEDETVRSVESFFYDRKKEGGDAASWKNLVFDHVPQPKKDKKEFVSLLKSVGGKPKMVLFYLKTDGTGMAAALAFGAAAKILNRREETKISLLRIQCMDWPDICEKHGVFIYPTVKVFTGTKNGSEESEMDFSTRDWRGMIDVDIVVTMATLLREDAVLKAGEATTELLRNEHFAKAEWMRLTARLVGLKGLFEEVALRHHGEAIFIAEEKEEESGEISEHCRFASSSGEFILLFRPWDKLQPRLCLDLASTTVSSAADLWAVISAAALRSPLPELTVKTFPQVVRDRKPLLILFVDAPQKSKSASKDLVNREDAFGEGDVAARFAEALIDGRHNAGSSNVAMTEEASAIGRLEALQGVTVTWMNVAAHPVHKEIFKAYHPTGMNQSLPAVSYVDLRYGKVVNVPLKIAMKGGSSWISGAAAKTIDHRTVSTPSVPAEDLAAMKVLELEKGEVAPSREHVDFKALIQQQKEEKKNKTKKGNEGEGTEENPEEDPSDDDEEEEIDLRGINKKSTKAPGKEKLGAKEMSTKSEKLDEEPILEEMTKEDLDDEIIEAEKFWKRDPDFLKSIAPNMESDEEKKNYNRVLKGLIQRNPDKKNELEGLAFSLEMPAPRHEEL